MDPRPDDPRLERRRIIEAVVASTVGTTIEWYDFFLYGAAAALVFPQLFFPDRSPFVAQILAFLTFTAGFVARPLGGVIFGYLGDRVGRKSTLVATLLLMGISTVLIGLLPTAAQIGSAAPVLLTLLRVLQGIGVGGEWGGAVLLALESGHRGRRGFYASWPQAGVPLGLLTSTSVMAAMVMWLPEDAFLAWGWRAPFWFSGVLILIGLVIRGRITETPLFARLKSTKQVSSAPVVEVLTHHWRQVLLAAGSRMGENASFYIFTVYIISHATRQLGLSRPFVLTAVCVAAGVEFFTIPLFGLLSDRWTRKRTYLAGCLFLMAFAWPYFVLLRAQDPSWVYLAVGLSLTVGHAILYSVQASLIPELFGTRLRYTGASLGYQLAAPFAGGLAPVIAETLEKAYPGQDWPLALYLAGMSAVSAVCLLALAETSGKDLESPG